MRQNEQALSHFICYMYYFYWLYFIDYNRKREYNVRYIGKDNEFLTLFNQ